MAGVHSTEGIPGFERFHKGAFQRPVFVQYCCKQRVEMEVGLSFHSTVITVILLPSKCS